MIRSAKGPEDSSVAKILERLALFRQTQGRLDEARALFEQALEIDRKTIGPQHPYYAQVLTYYATLLRKMKRKREAGAAESEAKSIIEASGLQVRVGQTVDVHALRQQ